MLAERKPLTSLLWNGKDLWQPFPPWMSVLVGLGNPYIPLSHVISGSSIIIKYVFQPFRHNLSNESLRQWWLQVFIHSVQMSMAFCSTTTLEQILKLGSQCCGSDQMLPAIRCSIIWLATLGAEAAALGKVGVLLSVLFGFPLNFLLLRNEEPCLLFEINWILNTGKRKWKYVKPVNRACLQ